MAHLFISLCGLNLEVDGSPVLEEVAADASDASSISVVQGDVAELFFDIDTNIVLGWCSESVALLCKDLHDILCEITASEIQCKMACGRT